MSYLWLASAIRTGEIIDELPHLEVGSISRTLMKYTTAQGTLPIPTAPESWRRATKGKATCLHLVDVDDRQERPDVPVFGAMVTSRTRGTGDTLELTLATIEAYFGDRYVGDVTYTGVGQNLIVKDLVERFVATGPNGGIPIRVVLIDDAAGTPRDRTYTDISDKTVYSALRELAGVRGGPEWTVEWEKQSDPERITPVLYVGARVGRPTLAGLGPAATFEAPGPTADATLEESYATGKGATVVLATTTASGDTRPQSAPVVTADPDRPTIEFRFSPSTSIEKVGTLDDHAAAKAAELAAGTAVLSMTAVADRGPRLGIDWAIGDDIGYVVGGPDRHDEETVPAFPGGLTGVARAIGWELSLTGVPEVVPVLQGAESLGDES